jgi:hypothetical protein
MSILLLEATDFLRSVVALEQEEQAIQRRCPATASFSGDAEYLVAIVDQRPSHRLGRRNVELDRKRLGDATGGLVKADRGAGGHVDRIPTHGM